VSFAPPPGAAAWTFTLAQPTGPNIGALTSATTRKLSFYLDAAATCAFSMPGAHPETAQVVELAVDVLCGRNGVALFRGRVGGSNDVLTADTDTAGFTATDYRGVLARRVMWSDATRSFRQEDQANIAWQFIADTQAEPGGGLGIVRGAAAATGVLRDRDYTAGQNVADALTQLGDCLGGFDWEIDAHRNFNLFYPARGRQTGLVLAYGRDIVEVHRTIDPTRFANAVFYTGSTTTTPVRTEVTTFDPEVGRWDEQKSDPNLILQPTVSDQAGGELDAASVFDPSFSVTLAAGAWDPTQLWVGDTAQLVIQAGRLNVNLSRRIIQIDVTLDDAGGEVVVLSVADAVPVLTNRLTSYNTRLNNVERALGYIPDAPVGTMFDWPGSTPPQLFAWADGSALPRATYPDLFAVIGTTYGPGDGSTTFNLPNCNGRVTLAAAGTYPAGSTGGAYTVALDAAHTGAHTHATDGILTATTGTDHSHPVNIGSAGDLPVHTHSGTSANAGSHNHTTGVPFLQQTGGTVSFSAIAGTNVFANVTVTTDPGHGHTFTTGNPNQGHTHTVQGNTGLESNNHQHAVTGPTQTAGGGTAHENMPPYIAIGKVIKILSAQST
jgi:microcystin-dependent protein